MNLKNLIEELQRAMPIVGEDAPVTASHSEILHIEFSRGRVTLLLPEPDIDDFPTFKDMVETADNETDSAQGRVREIKLRITLYLSALDMGAEDAIREALQSLRNI